MPARPAPAGPQIAALRSAGSRATAETGPGTRTGVAQTRDEHPPADPTHGAAGPGNPLGRVSIEKSIPPLKTFVEDGGTVLALGSSSTIGEAMGIPVTDHLVVKDEDGKPVLGENGKVSIA